MIRLRFFWRKSGMIVMVTGKKRNDDNVTANATEGRAIPVAREPKKMICDGPAQIKSVESAATPPGKPDSRATLPMPINAKATIQAGNNKASFAPIAIWRPNAPRESAASWGFMDVTSIASNERTASRQTVQLLSKFHR